MPGVTDPRIAAYAQYIADIIDATIFLGLTRAAEPSDAEVGEFLRDEGWCGRKYPLDYFRMDTIPPDLLPPET
jgi:hypothetical protein